MSSQFDDDFVSSEIYPPTASQRKEKEAVSNNLFGSTKPFSVYKKSLEEAVKEIRNDLVKEEGLKWPISDSRKTKQTGAKLNVSFCYGPVEFEDAPFIKSRQCFLRCPHRAPKNRKPATNDKGKQRIRKLKIKSTNCEAEIRLYEYKVFTVNRVPEGASRTERADAIAAVRESAEDTSAFELHTLAYQICRNHNHKIVPQRNAVSSEDMEFLTKMNSIGVVGDSTLTAQMNYQAQLGGTHSCISSFDVQTVANKRRKLQDRKSGLDGDMKRLEELVAEERDKSKESLIFVRYPTEENSEFGFLYQSDISLFILAVRTNCGFQPVAVWLSSREEGISITEYLQMLKDANPNWSPRFAMCDNCGAEFNGFLSVFPANSSKNYGGVKCLICTFHLLQAWRKWIYKSDNNVHPNQREADLDLLRDILYAKDWLEIQRKVDELKNKASPQVKRYYMSNYDPIIERWALCYRTKRIDKSNTNNGVEIMNKVFKYSSEKKRGKVIPVPEMITLLLRDFLRKKEASYREENFSNDEKMKEPMSNIPCYMVEAPKLLWNWWKKERKLRLKYDEEGKRSSKVCKVVDGVFLVSSSHRSEPHKLNIRGPTCTCRNFCRTHFPCRHMFQAIDDGLMVWEDLPEDYRNIPFFIKDKGSDIGIWPADVNKCCDYPASEDEDEEEEEDEEVGENRNARKKKRDIDYKGDWREVTNRFISFVNDPGFDVMDDDVRTLFLKKLTDTANDMAPYVYKRN
ncbi:uncharacterized protein LOC134823323 isoform X3 [Bolinopsis microptera]|uniref:uncharacterized protein LOC134823323 isoform X3 n=1 Tax=Bolinopsis microptera TaxID=2820187 RepID=UPI00307A6A90